MKRLVAQIQALVRELRRRQVIRVAVVYATTAFVILQLGEILVDPFRLGGWALRLVLFLLVLGFPLAIGLAWVYNVTEEGVVREVGEETAGEKAASKGSPLTSNGLVVGLLIVAIGLLLYPRVFSSGGPSAEGQPTAVNTAQVDERSVAVLPFEALGQKEPGVFTEGMHDDLLTRLSNISALKVISRTAVQQYRDTELTTAEIADSLGVRWVLEGGVQEMGDRIQVNAQLIDPRTETHVWAEDYRRDLTAEDLFAIQGEITGEIANALKAQLTAGEQERIAGAPTEDLGAYRLYVQGRSLMDSREGDSLEKALGTFKRALRQDSSYALAWAGLADARILLANYSGSQEAFPERMRAAIPEARTAARRARSLDPNLAEAYASEGIIYMYEQLVRSGRKNGPAALEVLTRAVKLKPSYAQAHHWLGDLYLQLGRPEAGLRHLRLAVELRPDHFSARRALGDALIANEKYHAALAEARRLQARYPERGSWRHQKGRALLHLNRWVEVRALAERHRKSAEDPPGWTLFSLALVDAATGDTTLARRRIQKLRERGPEWDEAVVHAALAEVDAAFKALPTPVTSSIGASRLLRYYYPDLLSAFRADPRYDKLIRNLNQAWGLGPDGSLPEDINISTSPADR